MKKSSTTPQDSKLKVSVFWGDILYDTALCGPNENVTVGRGQGNTFILDVPGKGFQNKNFELVRTLADESAEIHFSDDVDGHLRVGSELFSFKTAVDTKHVTKQGDGTYVARLNKMDKADFVIGHVSFYFDWVKDIDVIPPSPIFTKQRVAIFGGALLLLVILILINQFIEISEPEKPPERLVTIVSKQVNAPAKAAIGETKSADGGAQKGEAGKAELAAPEKPSAAAALKNANLGSLVSGLTSIGSNAPSVNAKPGVAAPIQQAGTGGFSTEGLKTGGGGQTVGIGRQVGKGEGGFEGTGRLGLSGNSAVEGGTGHGYGSTTSGGGLDRDVIESVIRRRIDRVRLCYERQLNFNPKLAGKISVHFVIGKRGEVLSSVVSEDTMKNDTVRSCILSEVKSWTFPAPEGGTIVNVDYPFVFESTAKGN